MDDLSTEQQTASAQPKLTRAEQVELYYWMQLTRTLDEMTVALWKQGRGVGGMFSQRGHEAISVGSGYALGPDDVVAPMHRDHGCYLLRGLTPRRIVGNLLGRAHGVSRGRDANMHGVGDLNFNLIGFISHLPQSLPVALGAAMSFTYRKEPRVAMTYVGDGSTSEGLFHETLNLAALFQAPYVLIVENNQYAYSTPLAQQMTVEHIADRAAAYNVPSAIVDGNDVEAVYAVTKTAIDRARNGGGPSLIEAKTMRMMGHAIHDGAEYVPRELLAEWEKRDPVQTYAKRLIESGIIDQVELDEIKQRCAVEITDAIEFTEQSPFPAPETVTEGVYAP
ncbi:MAG: thiamine pyrophosphate-dependent dehydrogenase E1 component subunit alpha [Caldilineaceae bacterium]|nr:thiamine pyrophosphate-dependent dehydrogenase E1 component subunit alpha [Caldilineaceae bacterium]